MTNDTKRFWTELVLILAMLAVKLLTKPSLRAWKFWVASTKPPDRRLEVVTLPEKVAPVPVIALSNCAPPVNSALLPTVNLSPTLTFGKPATPLGVRPIVLVTI